MWLLQLESAIYSGIADRCVAVSQDGCYTDGALRSKVVGVGVAGAILQGVLTSQLRQRITGPGSEELIRKIRTEATSIIYLPKDLRLKAVQSYAMGLRYVFLLVGALSIINTILAFSVRALYDSHDQTLISVHSRLRSTRCQAHSRRNKSSENRAAYKRTAMFRPVQLHLAKREGTKLH